MFTKSLIATDQSLAPMLHAADIRVVLSVRYVEFLRILSVALDVQEYDVTAGRVPV